MQCSTHTLGRFVLCVALDDARVLVARTTLEFCHEEIGGGDDASF